jgi:chemotaxis protein MotB
VIRRRQHQPHESTDRWLVSYADFVTLLLAVFVVIAATSQTDTLRARMVSASVKSALETGRTIRTHTISGKGPKTKVEQAQASVIAPDVAQPPRATVELLPSMQYLSEALANEILQGKIDLRLEPRGLVVSLRQATYFPSGGDRIAPDTYPALEKIAATIRGLSNAVRLEGHSDSKPIHTARFRSNWELSAARSIAMMELLSDRFEIPRSRLAIAGYADMAPIEPNDTETGRAHNRRVDIVILNQNGIFNEPGASAMATASIEDGRARLAALRDTGAR